MRFMGKNNNSNKKNIIRGTVVLMKKNVLDVADVTASFLDRLYELFGRGVRLQLISAVVADDLSGNKLGKPAYLEKWVTKITSLKASETNFDVTFEWDVEKMGIPGAFMVKNYHHSQLYLRSLTLHLHDHDNNTVHFVCNSWVYPAHRYNYDRVFFANKSYLPQNTPEPLRAYREEELRILRGDHGKEKLKEWDRLYDYAYYNDLGNPDKGPEYARPVLGGSKEYPYPRRGKTGRKPTKTDPKTESRLPLISLDVYVPRDERFGHIKLSDFLAYALKAIVQVIVPELQSLCDKTLNEFDSIEDVLKLYEGGLKLPMSTANKVKDHIPWELLKELLPSDGQGFLKYPMPEVIKEDKTAWRTDQEFAREMLAGLNPVVIRRLEEFPPRSKLDPRLYGNHNSTITKEHVEKNMDGFSVEKAIKKNRLFILDHHDALMPYLERVNSTTTKTYATRTVLFLKYDGTLKPLAIELSLFHPEGYQHGAVSQVYTPAQEGTVEGSVWQLAKAYAAVNDSGYHQLISHWLHTHGVIEPFVIATNRQLSVVHPIYKLLQPHFRDTMNINALARQILINAGGILETTVYPGKYSMELSSFLYKDWNFVEQALPTDLLNRGMAVVDPSSPHGLKLLIEDYPYAVDGIEIWSAIETWVREYCLFYYPVNELLQGDTELQSWWSEVRNEGHEDKRNEPWWPEMRTTEDLIKSCTIIIWIASALHAAVNYGQYPYAGYLPNRPTVSRRFMPQPGTPEYAELERDPDKAFLRTITAQFQTLLGISIIEILSMHSSDEIYLGQRVDAREWTSDAEPLAAFERFGRKLVEIEKKIIERNKDERLKNRVGPVKMPYTLLYPNTSDFSMTGGLTGKGIPNSVSL